MDEYYRNRATVDVVEDVATITVRAVKQVGYSLLKVRQIKLYLDQTGGL